MKVCSICGLEKPLTEFSVWRKWTEIACKSCRKEQRRERHYRSKYGISVGDLTGLITEQGGKCDICNTEFNRATPAVLDHCHTSGSIRGVLCHSCNLGIAKLKEDWVILKSAISYLKKHRWLKKENNDVCSPV
jgi:hypothetical protein